MPTKYTRPYLMGEAGVRILPTRQKLSAYDLKIKFAKSSRECSFLRKWRFRTYFNANYFIIVVIIRFVALSDTFKKLLYISNSIACRWENWKNGAISREKKIKIVSLRRAAAHKIDKMKLGMILFHDWLVIWQLLL